MAGRRESIGHGSPYFDRIQYFEPRGRGFVSVPWLAHAQSCPTKRSLCLLSLLSFCWYQRGAVSQGGFSVVTVHMLPYTSPPRSELRWPVESLHFHVDGINADFMNSRSRSHLGNSTSPSVLGQSSASGDRGRKQYPVLQFNGLYGLGRITVHTRRRKGRRRSHDFCRRHVGHLEGGMTVIVCDAATQMLSLHFFYEDVLSEDTRGRASFPLSPSFR
ncbi:hypothetical protein VTK73DRAFT_8878 [Phialemonium thermophilum]|uniref:Uncharacterized protein n=1 Tax=Phialemonium thermophilum TaxID=223376 RepID=A0ABR3W5R2_9PEZI